MSALDPLHTAPDVAVYAIPPEPDADASRFEGLVVSTLAGREICNRPEFPGTAFTRRLQRAVTLALDAPPLRDRLGILPEDRFCVLHLLRGGLDFDLREALSDAYGFERHASSFLSSQGYFARGAWHVREDAYLEGVRAYWQEVARLARDGFTLRDALAERWTADPATTWSPPRGLALDSPAALAVVCEERLATLDSR